MYFVRRSTFQKSGSFSSSSSQLYKHVNFAIRYYEGELEVRLCEVVVPLVVIYHYEDQIEATKKRDSDPCVLVVVYTPHEREVKSELRAGTYRISSSTSASWMGWLQLG